MNRPVLATAVLLSAALATAGCGGGSSSTAASSSASTSGAAGASSPGNGTQSYASMLDLGSAVVGGTTHCSNLTIQPTTVAKAQATCDLAGGKHLVLQLWRDAASRDAGVAAVTADRAGRHLGYCVVAGTGQKALWSVDASDDQTVCADIAGRLGGHVTKAAAGS